MMSRSQPTSSSFQIEAQQLAKRYRREWIVKNLTYSFNSGTAYAVLGPNGSGKSTLLKMLSGHLSPTRGSLHYTAAGKSLEPETIYQHVGYAAPYIELIEEMTLWEALRFHTRFRSTLIGAEEMLELLAFRRAKRKEIRHFSSGMKQRLKLVLACCTRSKILLLDEPTTNLDRQGAEWYLGLIDRFGSDRIVIVASNVETDYQFCTHLLSMLDFK